MSDVWARFMDSISDFLSENFKKRSMGIVCDFATEVNKVYTAVFPSKEIMQKILDDGTQNAMLFVHHPSIYDIRNAPKIYQQMDRELLQQFKDRKISIYNLHIPLDNFSEYSTSVTLAKVLGINPEKSFAPYFGSLCGVFGKTNLATIQDLSRLSDNLIDLHGQHQHQRLLNPDSHLHYLDAYGKLEPLVKQYQNTFQNYIVLKENLDSLLTQKNTNREKFDLYNFQINIL